MALEVEGNLATNDLCWYDLVLPGCCLVCHHFVYVPCNSLSPYLFLTVCLHSSYLASLEPVEEGERVNRHGANNEENVEDGECDQELVEEMRPARWIIGSFQRLQEVALSISSFVVFKFFHHLSSDGKFSLFASFSLSPREGRNCFGAHSSGQAYFIAVYAVPFRTTNSRGTYLYHMPGVLQ